MQSKIIRLSVLDEPTVLIITCLTLTRFLDKFWTHISIFVFFVIELWYCNDIRYTK